MVLASWCILGEGAMFRSYEPDQVAMFPVSPRAWLPDGHHAFFISDTVDQFDLSSFRQHYRLDGRGELAYHPTMMLKVLLYAYSAGVFSSRKIAQRLEEDVAFRFLSGGQFPNHRTICRFRERHLGDFEDLFVQVVQIAGEAGLVKMGKLAIDGSKVKANASKHKAMSYKRMKEEEKRLRSEIRALTEMAQGRDAAEDVEFGPDFRGDQLPEELQRRDSRLRVIKEARLRLEKRKAEQGKASSSSSSKKKSKASDPPPDPPQKPKPKDQENFTDPDSRIMKVGSKGFEQCYNAQTAVDGEAQIIVAADVGQCAADVGQLMPMIDQAAENTEVEPDLVLADAGYRSEENFQKLEAREIEALIPLGKEGKNKARNPEHKATIRMGCKMKTKSGRRRYKERKFLVEAPFGWIKNVLGFRTFSLRGLEKVGAEWNLVCLATNLRRMRKMVQWS